MDRKKYGLVRTLIVVMVGSSVGYAAQNNQPLLSVFSVVIGLILLGFVRRRANEPLVDERVERIAEKASRRALEVFGITAALLTAVLIALGREEGYVLGFAVCAVLVVYLAFYTIYSRSNIT
ncbi:MULTISPECIES: DUF2178 domain-containing protein [unclassified Archaeoglobus]|uniref:DUF2178 domain-containing protein n=1 Tax=unclassified Archaeoglobus TaxID=2643606 RepID=UPI0025B8FFD0|nr:MULTISPECIES: DUF2178 domain-containing protein [unclassified Archaeoglobus]